MAGLLATARQAALDAGKAILEIYTSGDYGVEAKADNSPLTQADKVAHATIQHHLQPTGIPILSEEGAQLPFEERQKWPWYWLVDPLDGTREFLKRNGKFTVNIALMHKNAPAGGVVYAPWLGTLYYGAKETGVIKETKGETVSLGPSTQSRNYEALRQTPGLAVVASRSHLTPETEQFIRQLRDPQLHTIGSSLKFMLLAENKADLYPRFGPTMEWDTAAAHAILIALNRGVYQTDLQSELHYNKPDLHNPSFIAF